MAAGVDKLRALEEMVVTVTSTDRTVTVEYGARTCDITISQGAFGRHSEQSLSKVVTTTLQTAVSAMRHEYERLRRELRAGD